MVTIKRTSCGFEREPLLSPIGFKGGHLSELWQSIALLESYSGNTGLGLGTQSTLWSDSRVFASNDEAAANRMMLDMTRQALHSLPDTEFETPFDLLDRLLPATLEYGRRVTGYDDLRMTFALNALVCVDLAAWQLYAAEMGAAGLDEAIPDEFRPALSHRHEKLALIPLISYNVSQEEIGRLLDSGCFFLKIKIGSDPAGDGDPEKMLEWDCQRLSQIHEMAVDRTTSYTESGWVPYYLDANGRYDSKERLLRLIDHADRIGALERIVLLEEPFPENADIDVHDVPVRLAADESAHSERDAIERIEMGYTAIALKPAGKTLSTSLRTARAAHAMGVPCFVADLTVNPVLLDWNKSIAARLAPLPGLKVGVVESNGAQNYRNWEQMRRWHPLGDAKWTEPTAGMFELDNSFYESAGGIFLKSSHYAALVD